MQPAVLIKLPKGDPTFLCIAVAFVSLFVAYVLVCWALLNAQEAVLGLLPIPLLVFFSVLYYPRRKVRRINARYEEQRASLPQDGDWRVLRRCRTGDEPAVRFIGYRFPAGGQHPAHDKQQWNPSLYDPAISSQGIPRLTRAVKLCMVAGALAWCVSSIALWLPPGGRFHMSVNSAFNTLSLVVVAASVVVWLASPLVTTEVWFAPGLIRVSRTSPWAAEAVVTDFAVEAGFVATLRHGRPDERVWFRRFPELLKLEDGRSSIEVSAAGLCPDDFWWAVTSDYRTTSEQMDTFFADGGR